MNRTSSRQFHFRRVAWAVFGVFCIIAIEVGYSLRSIPTQIRLALISHGDSRSVPFALRHLKSTDVSVRTMAARALGSIGPRAKPAVIDLLAALHDPSPEVASTSAWALGNIEFLSSDPKVIAALTDSMNHPDGEVRRYSAYALSLYGVRAVSATNALIDKLDDPHMASTAAQALGAIGMPARTSIPKLAALLKSENIGNRAEAAIALSKLQPLPDDIVLQIKDLLHDADPLVRTCARKASETITVEQMKLVSQQPTTKPVDVIPAKGN